MRPLIFMILLFPLAVSGQNSPVDYLDKLNADYDVINKDTWDYIRQVNKGRNARKIEKRRLELAETLRQAIYNVGKVPPYQGDPELKDAFSNYLKLSYQVINNGYAEIVDMEKVAEDSYDAMEAYLLTKERANKKMDSAFNLLMAAQDNFTEKHHIRVIETEDKISQKIENAGELDEYHNKIYLVFFKCSFYEAEMIVAQEQGRIGDIEQFRQTLAVTAEEGKEKLREIGSFNGDKSLNYACLNAMNYFKQEAETHMPKQLDFFTKKDKFETLSKNIESKKRNKLTQKEIDEYNEAVDAYNKSIETFNKTNDYLNRERTRQFKQFNDAIEDFYKKYM